jgi:hypothetical protein
MLVLLLVLLLRLLLLLLLRQNTERNIKDKDRTRTRAIYCPAFTMRFDLWLVLWVGGHMAPLKRPPRAPCGQQAGKHESQGESEG